MDLGRFLIETHLRTGRPIKELARVHHVSPSWLFKLLRRYRLEGPAGLEARSRRPRNSPTRIADLWEDEIVALRKELADFGADAGAQTIHYHLAKRHRTVPSQSTIWRVLRARGFVTEQPQKRPRSSYRRFVANLPNECWQADVTHVTLQDGAVFEVLNMIDDHSRLCVASRAFVTVKATDVVRTLHRSAENWGYPASMLTDNGLVFTAQRRYGVVGTFEQELFSLGIATKHSRPYHPQTCGKVERFHQTLKKFLAVQDGVVTKKTAAGPTGSLHQLLQRDPAPSPAHTDRGVHCTRACPADTCTCGGRPPQADAGKGRQEGRGHHPLQRPHPPHRHRRRLQGLAHLDARRPPEHRDRRRRRVAAQTAAPRPRQGLPTDGLTRSDGGLRCLDTSGSPMSRDITLAPPAGLEPATHGLGNRRSIL